MRLSRLSAAVIALLLIASALGPLALSPPSSQGHTPTLAAAAPDFALSLNPRILTLPRGTSGTSNLTLTASNGFQGTISLTTTITVNSTGVSAFLSNTTVTFTSPGVTTKNILLIVSTAIVNNPEVYYNVTVTGNSGTLSHAATLTLIIPAADIPPVAGFTFTPANPLPKQTIAFIPAGSFDPDGIIVSYNWTFGDFTHITVPANGTVLHAFNSTGSYYVLLTVTDNAGLKGFAAHYVTVGTATGGGLVARFTFLPNNPIVGHGVFFDASTSSDPNGTIVNYLWDFGDTTSQINYLPTMTHVYLIPGTVTVTLTVFDNFARKATTSPQLQIAPDPTSFLSALRFKLGENRTSSSVIDLAHGFAYFGLFTSPGIIVKVRLSDFSEVASLTLATGENQLISAAIDPVNGFAYFGTGTIPGIIVKINLSTFTQVGSIPLNSGEPFVYTALIDAAHGFAYFGVGNYPSEIIKIRLSDFTRNATLTMPVSQTQLESGVIDPVAGYAYFGTFTSPGIIVKIRLSDFTEVNSLNINQGEGFLTTATIDPGSGFAYFAATPFGGSQSFGTIIKVNLSNFTRSGSLALQPGEFGPVAAMTDTTGGFSYFVIVAYSNGEVIRVQLSNFTRQRTIVLLPGEGLPQTALLGPGGGFIYVGTADRPALIVRLDTAAFNVRPTASFTFSPTNPITGQQVTFDGSSSSDPGGYVVSYRWNFGDGFNSTFGPFTQHAYSNPGNYTVNLTIMDNGGLSSVATHTIIVVAKPPDLPPIAQFTFSPANPQAGTIVSFDAGQSRDPDGYITSYAWNFGDNTNGFGSFTQHTYLTAGNFTVTLTVTDNAGLIRTAFARITISPRLQHDVAVTGVFPNFNTAIQSQTVSVTVNLANYGLNNETVTVSIFFNSTLVATRTNIPVFVNNFYGNQVFIQFDTSNIQPGTYTVSATAILATDQNLSNNSLSDGKVTMLPGPKLTVAPTSGTLGTKVTVQGSSFATNQYGYPNQILVTFDDMFEGFITTSTGSFNFTMNIPHAEPGIHLIKAFDSTNAHASTSFTVLPQPGSLTVTITVGAIYFPGDKADIYSLTSVNGVPVGPSGVSVGLTATLPNGTTLTLPMSSIGPGLYRASFTLPNQLGTYALVARASINSSHASALASFEVKPSWLASHGPAVLSIATVGAVIGLVALLWRTSYSRKDQQL